MPANPLIFKDAEKARDALLVSQKKEIAALYQQWADEIGERADYYAHKSTASSVVSERQMRELQKMMEETSKQVANEVYNDVTRNLYTVADSVVRCNNEWLASLGFNPGTVDAVFNYVPDDIVRNIVSGQIYDSGWSLSSRIWSDNEDTMKQAYQIVAGGVAQNKSMYEIAKDLEKYVSPSAARPWNLKAPDGKRIYPRMVDYNAQRLGRTLVQHGYQQSFVATTQKNPFITDYIWVSNGSRVCEICQAMDGQHFAKDNLPLDHPNGMCTMVPNVVDNLIDQLADWFNEPDGTYPEIDQFSKNFGYTPKVMSYKGVEVNINSLKNNLEEYVGGGYSSIKDAVTSEEFKYIHSKMETSSQSFYRLEEAQFTIDAKDLRKGDNFAFTDDLRSFTSERSDLKSFIEQAEDWGGYENPVVFQTVGEVKHFDMSPYTKEYTKLMGDQHEHLVGGEMQIVDFEYKFLNGVEVLFAKIKQIK